MSEESKELEQLIALLSTSLQEKREAESKEADLERVRLYSEAAKTQTLASSGVLVAIYYLSTYITNADYLYLRNWGTVIIVISVVFALASMYKVASVSAVQDGRLRWWARLLLGGALTLFIVGLALVLIFLWLSTR